jgi:hypothetical protein
MTVLRWLTDHFSMVGRYAYAAFAAACCNGRLDAAKWLLQRYGINWKDMQEAFLEEDPFWDSVLNNHLDVAEWLTTVFPPEWLLQGVNDEGAMAWLDRLFERRGATATMKWLVERVGLRCDDSFFGDPRDELRSLVANGQRGLAEFLSAYCGVELRPLPKFHAPRRGIAGIVFEERPF